MNRRDLLLAVVVVVAIAVPVVHALTFSVDVQSGTRLAADQPGPAVHFDEDRDLATSEALGAGDGVYVQVTEGSAWYNGTVETRAQVDVVNDTWSNLSEMDVTNGNMTINPDGLAQSSISGDATIWRFEGEAEVDDGAADAFIDGSGSADVTLASDGTDGNQYGLVDVDTSNALARDIANADGTLHFQDVDLSSHTVGVQSLGELTLRNETEPHGLIDVAGTSVQFFSLTSDTVVNRTDDNNDGIIDFSGLPTDERFVVVIEAPGYAQCQVIIEDLSQQETAYCLHTATASPPGLEKEFVVEDQTGKFDTAETELIIERAINESRYDPGAGYNYKNVRGDQVGADRAFITTIQEDARYRLRLRNDDGDVRQLGAFTPKTAGVTTLEVRNITTNQTDLQDIRVNASLTNTSSGLQVTVNYNDTRDMTDQLYIEVYERGNRSNTLISNTSFVGPLGEASVSQSVPSDENETTWLVRITANRDNAEDYNAQIPLSPRDSLLPGLPGWFVAITSVGLIWVTAGLFSQINGDIGAIVVAALGAMLWFVDLVPEALGVGVVILAMVTAGLIFINERRDGGL